MWNINNIVSKGDYIYTTVKEHPNATKNGYVLLHRIIMENHLKRLLTKQEIVHHKDGNKKNNDLSNLELMEKSIHNKEHGLEKKRWYVKLKCPQCNTLFIRPKNNSFLNKKSKYSCCSKSCSGRFSRNIQLNGITEEIQKQIDNNVIDIYKDYTASIGTGFYPVAP